MFFQIPTGMDPTLPPFHFFPERPCYDFINSGFGPCLSNRIMLTVNQFYTGSKQPSRVNLMDGSLTQQAEADLYLKCWIGCPMAGDSCYTMLASCGFPFYLLREKAGIYTYTVSRRPHRSFLSYFCPSPKGMHGHYYLHPKSRHSHGSLRQQNTCPCSSACPGCPKLSHRRALFWEQARWPVQSFSPWRSSNCYMKLFGSHENSGSFLYG